MNKAMQDMSKMQIPRKAKPSAPPPPPPPPPPPTAPPPLDAAFGSGVSQANQESIQRDSRKRESGGSDGPGRHEADSKRRRSGERSRFSERRDESRVVQKPGETGQDLTPRSKVKNLEQYKGAQYGHSKLVDMVSIRTKPLNLTLRMPGMWGTSCRAGRFCRRIR